MRPTVGLMVHQRVGARLQRVSGRLATAPAWTAVEVARQLRRPRALATLDAALRSMRCARSEIENAVAEQRGRRGIVAARELLPFADGRAESAMESEARLVMIDHGLPLPELQYPIHGHGGEMWRVDFAWPDMRLAATAATVTPAAPAALAAPAAPATTALSLGWVATEVRAALAAMVLPASVAGAGWVAPGAPAAPATRGPLEQAPVGPVATGGRAVAAASASSLVSAVSAASVARGPSPQVPPAAPVAAVASAGSAAANSCRPRGSPRRHAAMLLPVGRYPPTSRHGIGRRTGLPGSPTRGPANSITSAGQPMMPVIADQPIITAIKPAARPAPHFCDVRCST